MVAKYRYRGEVIRKRMKEMGKTPSTCILNRQSIGRILKGEIVRKSTADILLKELDLREFDVLLDSPATDSPATKKEINIKFNFPVPEGYLTVVPEIKKTNYEGLIKNIRQAFRESRFMDLNKRGPKIVKKIDMESNYSDATINALSEFDKLFEKFIESLSSEQEKKEEQSFLSQIEELRKTKKLIDWYKELESEGCFIYIANTPLAEIGDILNPNYFQTQHHIQEDISNNPIQWFSYFPPKEAFIEHEEVPVDNPGWDKITTMGKFSYREWANYLITKINWYPQLYIIFSTSKELDGKYAEVPGMDKNAQKLFSFISDRQKNKNVSFPFDFKAITDELYEMTGDKINFFLEYREIKAQAIDPECGPDPLNPKLTKRINRKNEQK